MRAPTKWDHAPATLIKFSTLKIILIPSRDQECYTKDTGLDRSSLLLAEMTASENPGSIYRMNAHCPFSWSHLPGLKADLSGSLVYGKGLATSGLVTRSSAVADRVNLGCTGSLSPSPLREGISDFSWFFHPCFVIWKFTPLSSSSILQEVPRSSKQIE